MRILMRNGFQINLDKPLMDLKDKEYGLLYSEKDKILLNRDGMMLLQLLLND